MNRNFTVLFFDHEDTDHIIWKVEAEDKVSAIEVAARDLISKYPDLHKKYHFLAAADDELADEVDPIIPVLVIPGHFANNELYVDDNMVNAFCERLRRSEREQ